jgi:hypothetical protein
VTLRASIKALLAAKPLDSAIDHDERVLFFPTPARLLPNHHWQIPIHGKIYQPIELSRLRKAALSLAKNTLQLTTRKSAAELDLFRERFGEFLADNERGNRIKIRIAQSEFQLNKSRPNGHFEGQFNLPDHALHQLLAPNNKHTSNPQNQWLHFRAVMKKNDPRTMQGQVLLLPDRGLSVISDIDDTIKVTDVLQRRQLLANTFVRDFQSVPQMAALYTRWARQHHAAFHYVSASPWALYPFLSQFLDSQNFPQGTWHLREFRLVGRDLVRAFRSAKTVKQKHLHTLLTSFPNRHFYLLGDSGEHDPLLYATLAQQFPTQIQKIFIRQLPTTNPNELHTLFKNLPPKKYQLFTHPSQLP